MKNIMCTKIWAIAALTFLTGCAYSGAPSQHNTISASEISCMQPDKNYFDNSTSNRVIHTSFGDFRGLYWGNDAAVQGAKSNLNRAFTTRQFYSVEPIVYTGDTGGFQSYDISSARSLEYGGVITSVKEFMRRAAPHVQPNITYVMDPSKPDQIDGAFVTTPANLNGLGTKFWFFRNTYKSDKTTVRGITGFAYDRPEHFKGPGTLDVVRGMNCLLKEHGL